MLSTCSSKENGRDFVLSTQQYDDYILTVKEQAGDRNIDEFIKESVSYMQILLFFYFLSLLFYTWNTLADNIR